jgi:hypothetical protein
MQANRRRLFHWGAAAALASVPVAMAQQDSSDESKFIGPWNTVHSLPFPPGAFREFLSILPGGVVKETNSFLQLAAPLDFSMFGLPNAIRAADGVGSWKRVDGGRIAVVFHKLLFDGDGRNFADLRASGTMSSDGTKMNAEWFVEVIGVDGNLIAPLGPATSEGTRIGA